MSTHLILAVGIIGMATAIFWLGWSSRAMWGEWKDDKALRAAEDRYERHTHRKGDPQETTPLRLPRAGRLEQLADPAPHPLDPPFWFAGEQDPGWAAEAAEYERPHQPEVGSLDWTAARLAEVCADERAERLTDTGEMRALSAAWIEKMQGDSNEWIFTHLMRTSDG